LAVEPSQDVIDATGFADGIFEVLLIETTLNRSFSKEEKNFKLHSLHTCDDLIWSF
jgi:hypothetical protein